MFEQKDRLWDITSNRLNAAASFAPTPSREALIEQVKTLKEELDETRVSKEDLDARYDTVRQEADAAIALQEQSSLEAEAARQEIIRKDLEWEKKIRMKGEELIEVQKIVQAASDTDKAQADWQRSQVRWIMGVTGVLALGALAGVIFVPVLKKEFGMFAAILGGITIALPFLTPVHIAIVFGLCLLIGLGLIARKFFISDKAQKAVYRGIQEWKEESPDLFKTELAPKLENWTGKYDKNGKVIQDSAIRSHIDSVLMEVEAK
jgi:hypothetical protein